MKNCYLRLEIVVISQSQSFGNAKGALLRVIERYKSQKKDELFADIHETAKSMYDKFYAQAHEMLEYCRINRAKIANDREFFESLNYKELKNINGDKVYSDKELFVLKELGGGEFLLGIYTYQTAKSVIDKIEYIIKNIITKKYLNKKIENKSVAEYMR